MSKYCKQKSTKPKLRYFHSGSSENFAHLLNDNQSLD